MAVNRNGRVIYLDADGTYNAIFPDREPVRLDEVVLVAGSAAAASLTLYDDVVTTNATRKIAVLQAAAGTNDQLVLASDDRTPPESTRGLSAVLSGTGAQAFLYIR